RRRPVCAGARAGPRRADGRGARLGKCEDAGAVVGDGDGVLGVRRAGAVHRLERPPVRRHLVVAAPPRHQHGLDSGDEATPRPPLPSWATAGPSGMGGPIPWPPKPAGTPSPAPRATVPIACEMSPRRAPSAAAAIPAASAFSVASMSVSSAGLGAPTMKLV